MANESHLRRVSIFAMRLALVTPVVLALWWLSMPVYAWCVGQCAALILRLGGYSIHHVIIKAGGFLNTDTTLGFDLGDRVRTTPVSWVVTNVAVYIALVLATRRMDWKRRLRALAIGCAILSATHVTHIVIYFHFAKAIARGPQVPTAIAQIFITLPFLLWIVFAYWKQGTAFEPEDRARRPNGE